MIQNPDAPEYVRNAAGRWLVQRWAYNIALELSLVRVEVTVTSEALWCWPVTTSPPPAGS